MKSLSLKHFGKSFKLKLRNTAIAEGRHVDASARRTANHCVRSLQIRTNSVQAEILLFAAGVSRFVGRPPERIIRRSGQTRQIRLKSILKIGIWKMIAKTISSFVSLNGIELFC